MIEKTPPSKKTIPSLFKAFSFLVPGFYAIGFVIVNAHLGSLSISDTSLFNSQYLFAGVQYLALTFPVFAIIWQCHPNPTDNLEKSLIPHLNGLYYTSTYGSFVTTILIPPNYYASLFIFLMAFAQFIATSYTAKNWNRWVIIILMAIPLLIFFFYLALTGSWIQFGICSGLIILYLQFSTLYGEWGDGEINIIRLSFLVIIFLTTSGTYGYHAFKHIPTKFGGGQSRDTQLVVDPDYINTIQTLPIKDNDFFLKKVKILHESPTFYFIDTEDKSVLAVKKQCFIAELYKK